MLRPAGAKPMMSAFDSTDRYLSRHPALRPHGILFCLQQLALLIRHAQQARTEEPLPNGRGEAVRSTRRTAQNWLFRPSFRHLDEPGRRFYSGLLKHSR
jgi:hypothetical protein